MPADRVLLDAAALRAALAPGLAPTGASCEHPACAGWESIPAPIGEPALQRVGTLRDADPIAADPTLDEWHPNGTHYWSANAPVATRYFPYNRCSVWRCAGCARGFVQYTEYGGYYVDHRIREINPDLMV